MKTFQTSFLVTICFIIASLCFACTKSNSCYDEQLYQLHKNDFCTADWQNVLGCDGRRYGNECDANRQGIWLR